MAAVLQTPRALLVVSVGLLVLVTAGSVAAALTSPSPAVCVALAVGVCAAAVGAGTAAVRYVLERPEEMRRERMRATKCPQCGYDLRGNVTRVCPECGACVDVRLWRLPP